MNEIAQKGGVSSYRTFVRLVFVLLHRGGGGVGVVRFLVEHQKQVQEQRYVGAYVQHKQPREIAVERVQGQIVGHYQQELNL